MEKIFIATPYGLNAGQLVGIEHDNQQVVVQVIGGVSREEYKANNPEARDEDPGPVNFYETEIFTGEVVLAMQQEKNLGDIVRNEAMGTWQLLRYATPTEYIDSLIKHGEAGPGSPVLEPILTLIRAGQNDVRLYWATPHLPATAALHLTKEELLFIGRLLHDWQHDPEKLKPEAGTNTFVIAKFKEALGKLAGQEAIQKISDNLQNALKQDTAGVDRVH